MAKSFYIIDGHAQIFRAYYAPFRPLSSPSGEPTRATYVFSQGLLNLLERRKPDAVVMVIDTGSKNLHRTRLYPEYKANRKPAPDDFRPQEQRIFRIVRDAGIPVLGLEGFEADDLIATLAHRLADQDYQVFVVSRDKDLRQIVTDKVVLYDMQSDEVIDAAAVERLYGYTPAQAVEVQTLTGDSTDNVPGVPGVGEKTAAKLVAQYGSVDAILQNLNALSPKLKENIDKSRDILTTSRQLVTLVKDAPLDLDLATCCFSGVNKLALKKHFEELGFKQLVARLDRPETLGKDAPAPPPAAPAAAAIAGDLFGGLFGQEACAPAEGTVPPAPEAPAGGAPPIVESDLATSEGLDYRLVDSEERLAEFLAGLRAQSCFAFDTETDALGAMNSQIIGMSFSWQQGTGWYLPVAGPLGARHLPRERVIEAVKPVLEDGRIGKVGHNIKYDLLVMRCAGVQLRGIVSDTMIAAFLLDSSRFSYGIDRLAAELLQFRKIPTSHLIGSGKTQISMAQVSLDRVCHYACEDADMAWRLHRLLQAHLAECPPLKALHDDVEVPLISVLADMEETGVCVGPAMLREQSAALGDRAESLKQEIMKAAGASFNPDSPKQLADILFVKLGLPVIKRNRTGASTDVEVLDKLADQHPVPKLILEYRQLIKLKNTYLDALPAFINRRTGRIHASFSQVGAETGRLSCNDPNLQNIPIRTDEGRRIRLAFVPQDRENSVLLTADYSQIELRVLAHFTQEPALVRAFEADEDIHRAVAAEVFSVPLDAVSKDQRSQAKVVNFGIIYGVSAFGLARRIEGLSQQAAKKLIDAYHARFPTIRQFLEQCVRQAHEKGFVETIMGRRRFLPMIESAIVAQRNAAERMAINSVVQGSAADLIKVAMLNIQRRLQQENRPSRMLLQVHDELVFETPREHVQQEADLVREEMEKAMSLRVPLKVEVGWGANWQEGK
jgi:DNA polymerase-1